jgi:hypothetical protein
MPETSPQLPIAYRGRRTEDGTAFVEALTAIGAWHLLDPRLDLRNHSPTGFEWGYGGSGPAQLALALAASRLPDDLALILYQRLKFKLVGRLCRQWRFQATYLDDLLARIIAADAAADAREERDPGAPSTSAAAPEVAAS